MRSFAEVDAELTAKGQFFEIETIEIRGIPTRTWKNTTRSLRELFLASEAHPGDRPFIILGDERVTYADHTQRVKTFARRLVDEFGVQHGDRVAIAMRNYPEWSIAFFAATSVGAVAVALNAWWTGPELAFGIVDSGTRIVVADGERLARLGGELEDGALNGVDLTLIGTRLEDRPTGTTLPPDVAAFDVPGAAAEDLPDADIAPHDLATIFYTSGTTGLPKGVVGTHHNMCSVMMNLMYVGARMPARFEAPAPTPTPPVSLLPVPLFHATGCHSILVSTLLFGGTLVFMRRWDPEVAADLIERERVTGMPSVPSMALELLSLPDLDKRDLSSLKTFGGGGAAAPPDIVRRATEHLPSAGIGTGYGMTETSTLVCSIAGPDYTERPASVGVPIPVCEVRIVDATGHDVPAGAKGEIWMRGPNVVPGYWQRPDETARTFTEGFVHSGDIGRFDDEGFLYIVDRIKDLIIRGGENIASAEVEAALFEHPAVADAAVFGVPHEMLGEDVAAVVQLHLDQHATEEELRAHVASRLASFKVPSVVQLTTEPLPRNPAGKVVKRELRDRLLTSP